MATPKFPDYASPTQLAYIEGRPTEIHLRRCKFIWEKNGKPHETIFDSDIVTIGAMEDNDLVINHDTVSRYHAKVIQEPNGYILLDENSTNGTFINQVRIREAYLVPGCHIQLGKIDMRFFFADEKVKVMPSSKEKLGQLVGRSLKMREIYGIIEKIANTATTVVIEGETGTGKEVAAQTIHDLSHRKNGPMMIFDCGAVPANLIESELFGHEKGSFTGATMTRQGIFELAHGGTLFLDELGELDLELQPKLLRALEQREIRRVGSSRPIKVDVRVIAATNRNLEEEVAAGRFRQDLFYRLSVVKMTLPPLRERVEDIALLVRHLLDNAPFNRRPDGSLRVNEIERSALDLLNAYQWRGNVRELVNVIERAISFADGAIIKDVDLPEPIRLTDTATGSVVADISATFKDAKERWVSSFERDYIVTLLRKNEGNISHAAREAEIDRKYFRKLMKKYEINAAEFQS